MARTIIALATALIFVGSTAAGAQSRPTDQRIKANGESVTQPQGETGPINTKSGGAPASSPQGDTPAGMQSAPEGSSVTIKTDKSGIPDGTPKK